MLFRVQTIVSIVKGHPRVGFSNKVNAALMLILPIAGVIAAGWYSGIAAKYYLPEAVSIHGKQTDFLFWVAIYIIVAMFLVTNAALFYFAYKYQYKEGRKVTFFYDNAQLEMVWTAVPAIILTVLVLWGNKVWWNMMSIPEDQKKQALQIEIMGKQFGWYTRYPGKDNKLGRYDFRLIDEVNEFGLDFEDKASEDDFMPKELHIPVGKPVVLNVRARDVLHSVFAPHFRLKMDAVPGMRTQFFFIPTKTTAQMRAELGKPDFNYEIACTEVCGKGHFAMKYIIVVEEEKEFKKWYAEQKPFLENNPEYRGKGMKSLLKKNLADSEKNKKQKELAEL